MAQLEAQVQADQGAIDNAKAVLSYTKIVAPLAGRTGLRLVEPGNIVHAGDTTGIVVITQIKPIAVIFTLPQQQLAQVNKAIVPRGRSASRRSATIIARWSIAARSTVVDNQVDPTTGTVKLKAEFPMPTCSCGRANSSTSSSWSIPSKQVITIPTAAVQRGPNGTFVYVANGDEHGSGPPRHRGPAGRRPRR